jgi:hypothetical protein
MARQEDVICTSSEGHESAHAPGESGAQQTNKADGDWADFGGFGEALNSAKIDASFGEGFNDSISNGFEGFTDTGASKLNPLSDKRET